MTAKNTFDQFTSKARATHGERYDYSRVVYQDNRTPVDIVCAEHGVFHQRPGEHIKGKGCRECGKAASANARRGSLEGFLVKAQEVHGNRYTYGKYHGYHAKMTLTCAVHGLFDQAPAHHLAGQGCPECALEEQSRRQYLDQDDFLVRARAVHGTKYDYSRAIYTGCMDSVVIGCPEHGDFKQAPTNHWSGQGCRECYNQRHSAHLTKDTAQFITSATARHGDQYDYSQVQYVGSKLPVLITCSNGHEFKQKPNDHLDGHGCSVCTGTGASQPEVEIQAYLESLGKSVTAGCRASLGDRKEVDLLVENLAIEYDGLYWHSEAYRGPDYHIGKTRQAAAHGLQMVHIFEDEWLEKSEIVKARLAAKLGVGPRTSARKLHLVEVTWLQARAFYNAHHLQGAGVSGTSFGLMQGEDLVACITLARRRGVMEILRYATLGTVVGGFGRLFQAFLRSRPDVDQVVSYADLRWGTGQVYATQGFVRGADTPPGYFWVKKLKRYSREKFQKHKLAKLLPDFDPAESEVKNMHRHGYSRIYDCGHAKWVWNRESA